MRSGRSPIGFYGFQICLQQTIVNAHAPEGSKYVGVFAKIFITVSTKPSYDLFGSLFTWHKLERREPQARGYLHEINLWDIFLVSYWSEKWLIQDGPAPSVSCHPWTGSPGCLRKQTYKTRRRQAVSGIPSWSLPQFRPPSSRLDFPPVTGYKQQAKETLCFENCFWSSCFLTAPENLRYNWIHISWPQIGDK